MLLSHVRQQNTRLENWQLIRGHLVGTVSGHPDHVDGETIHTSDVLDVVTHRRVRTRDREYQLGSPDPTWVRLLQLMRSNLNRRTSQCDSGPRRATAVASRVLCADSRCWLCARLFLL